MIYPIACMYTVQQESKLMATLSASSDPQLPEDVDAGPDARSGRHEVDQEGPATRLDDH